MKNFYDEHVGDVPYEKMHLDPFSKKRSCKALGELTAIVLHYTATGGATARNIFDFYKRTADDSYASAHLFVDNDEIIEMIPLNEVAWHVGAKRYLKKGIEIMEQTHHASPNYSTIGVEMCQQNITQGSKSIPKKTVTNTINLIACLCLFYGFENSKIITTHANITGKHCPAIAIAGGSFGGSINTDTEPVMSTWYIDFKTKVENKLRELELTASCCS